MRSKHSLPAMVLIGTILILFSFSCGKKSDIRSYKEKVSGEEPSADPHGHSHGTEVPEAAAPGIQWEKPESWELLKSESKLRLATFQVRSGDREAVCTMIPLSGDAGGLQANIQMWRNSINGSSFTQPELDEFISKQKRFRTRSGQEGIFIDFTGIAGKESDLTIIVSMITFPDKTLFIKLAGNFDLVIKNRDELFKLSISIDSGE